MESKSAAQVRTEAEGDLIARARHDRGAFAELYDLYVRRVYAFCTAHSATREEAEDVTAQTFERALAAIERYEDRGRPFSAWLLRIAANAVSNSRRRQRYEASKGANACAAADLPETDHWVEQWERAFWLRAHLATLPPDQRQVVYLRFFVDSSVRDVALTMRRSEDAVKQLQRRALITLRARLQQEALQDV